MRRILGLCLVACACSQPTPVGVEVPDTDSLDLRGADAGVARAIVTKPLLMHVLTRDSAGVLIPPARGGGEAVHPSVACSDVRSLTCYMVVSPYAGSNARLENPSVFRAVDSITWVEPAGVSNPVVRTPARAWYNSDPDLNYDGESGGYFFSNRLASFDTNETSVLESNDAAKWTRGGVLVAGRRMLVSQSVTVGHDGVPRLYYVNASGCLGADNVVELREAVDGADGAAVKDASFGPAQIVDLLQPGYVPWHLEVRWVAALHRYVGLLVAYPENSNCAHDDLFVVTSEDGITFRTYPHPLMWRGNPWGAPQAVYRSTAVYDEDRDLLRVWMSAYATAPCYCDDGYAVGHWSVRYMSVSWRRLILRLEQLDAAGLAASFRDSQADSSDSFDLPPGSS